MFRIPASLLEDLDRHAGAFSFVSSVVLTFITAVYVFLTRRLLDENRQLRLLQTEPAVVVSVVLSRGNFVALRIENIGYGPAVDVNLQSDPGELPIDLAATQAGSTVIPMSKFGPFKNGISLLPPSSSLELALFPLMHGWAPSEGDFRITVRYKTADRRAKGPEVFTLGFSHLAGTSAPADLDTIAAPLHQLVHQMGAIERQLATLRLSHPPR